MVSLTQWQHNGDEIMTTFGELEVGDFFFDEITELVFEKICENLGEANRELGKDNTLCPFSNDQEVRQIYEY
jgi:hypothetical protein